MIAYMADGPMKGKQLAFSRLPPYVDFPDYPPPDYSYREPGGLSMKDELKIIRYEYYKPVNDTMAAYRHVPEK